MFFWIHTGPGPVLGLGPELGDGIVLGETPPVCSPLQARHLPSAELLRRTTTAAGAPVVVVVS